MKIAKLLLSKGEHVSKYLENNLCSNVARVVDNIKLLRDNFVIYKIYDNKCFR